MRYIGSKVNLLKYLELQINNLYDSTYSFCDLFAGTGVLAVGRYFKRNFKVMSNDLLYFSYVLQKATIELNEVPDFRKLVAEIGIDPFEYFALLDEDTYHFDKPPFFFHQYSPSGEAGRQYFTPNNALRIDAIRQIIEEWRRHDLITEQEYFYLVAGLVEAVPFVSNIAGTYGAFLKTWDKRAFKMLNPVKLQVVDNGKTNQCFNKDSNCLIKDISGDILYIDPPYNGRQYISNYHILETVARYDYPNLRGKTGLRQDSNSSSKYCKRSEVFQSFDALIAEARFDHILVSYSNEGLMTEEQISSSLKSYGKPKTLRIERIPFRRYKRISGSVKHNLNELIFSIEK